MFRSVLLKDRNLNFFFYLRVHAFARNCPGHWIFLTNLWEFLKCLGDIFLVVRFDRAKMFHPFNLKKNCYVYLSCILMEKISVKFLILYLIFLKKKCPYNPKPLRCFPVFSCVNLSPLLFTCRLLYLESNLVSGYRVRYTIISYTEGASFPHTN